MTWHLWVDGKAKVELAGQLNVLDLDTKEVDVLDLSEISETIKIHKRPQTMEPGDSYEIHLTLEIPVVEIDDDDR